MHVSDAGIALLKGEEGFGSVLYQDSGKPAIGYGCDLTPEEAASYKGKTITEQEAADLLVQRAGPVQSYINADVNVPLTQNQYDALVSLVYNIGVGNFHKSSILELLNKGDYGTAAQHFLLYDESQGKKLTNLAVRRTNEAALFMRKD